MNIKICPLTGLQLSTMSKGRYAVKVVDHPAANNRGYILRSRYIMEQHLGRYLLSSEEVHHINEDKTDDRIENLEIKSKSEHARDHMKNKSNFPINRKLDYEKIKELRLTGIGYTKIAKTLDYKIYSVKNALKRIEKSINGGE